MSEDNLVYEITRMLTDKTAVRKDMDDAASLVQNMIHDRYLKKLDRIAQEHGEKIQQNPSREVNLLAAFKPFVDEGKHEQLDKMIETLIMRDTLRSIQEEFGAAMPVVASQAVGNQEVKKDSIHDDGIYDIDDSCVRSINQPLNPLKLMLLMALSTKNPHGSIL